MDTINAKLLKKMKKSLQVRNVPEDGAELLRFFYFNEQPKKVAKWIFKNNKVFVAIRTFNQFFKESIKSRHDIILYAIYEADTKKTLHEGQKAILKIYSEVAARIDAKEKWVHKVLEHLGKMG
jgi:hypothetical protein